MQAQGTIPNIRVEHISDRRRLQLHTTDLPSTDTRKAEKTKLCIKNMVSIRCKMVLTAVLENLGLAYSRVELGEVEIIGKLSYKMHERLKSDLLACGLELMDHRKIILVEKIRRVLVDMIRYSDEPYPINFSDYLSDKLNHNYTYLANLFSEVKGMSIQHFIISHKIEYVKELLMYDELTLSEIAWKLRYSSVAHLSNQFHKIAGITPTHFKQMKCRRRCVLDSI